jgi:hypothetical protein
MVSKKFSTQMTVLLDETKMVYTEILVVLTLAVSSTNKNPRSVENKAKQALTFLHYTNKVQAL